MRQTVQKKTDFFLTCLVDYFNKKPLTLAYREAYIDSVSAKFTGQYWVERIVVS